MTKEEALWECECDCDAHNHLIVLGSNLRTGHTTSCGCERRSKGELAVAKILNDNKIPFSKNIKHSNLLTIDGQLMIFM